MDKKYESRYRHEEDTIWRSDDHYTRQSQMETSNSSLIIILLMEDRERERESGSGHTQTDEGGW